MVLTFAQPREADTSVRFPPPWKNLEDWEKKGNCDRVDCRDWNMSKRSQYEMINLNPTQQSKHRVHYLVPDFWVQKEACLHILVL